jgi:hypothetical protein
MTEDMFTDSRGTAGTTVLDDESKLHMQYAIGPSFFLVVVAGADSEPPTRSMPGTVSDQRQAGVEVPDKIMWERSEMPVTDVYIYASHTRPGRRDAIHGSIDP